MTRHTPLFDDIHDAVEKRGFAFVSAPEMSALLGLTIEDIGDFAESWHDLGEDRYMADGGRYRRRRHTTFDIKGAATVRRPHQPHYQATAFNALNGGIERWFEPVTDRVAAHIAMRRTIDTCRALFESLTPSTTPCWFVEVHQFRIEASATGAAQPTPEGAHRDGVDWVLVMLLARENIASGVTTISDLVHRHLGSFTLTHAFDAAIVDDSRVFHGVTAVEPLDPTRPAYRDVLVVTFKKV